MFGGRRGEGVVCVFAVAFVRGECISGFFRLFVPFMICEWVTRVFMRTGITGGRRRWEVLVCGIRSYYSDVVAFEGNLADFALLL